MSKCSLRGCSWPGVIHVSIAAYARPLTCAWERCWGQNCSCVCDTALLCQLGQIPGNLSFPSHCCFSQCSVYYLTCFWLLLGLKIARYNLEERLWGPLVFRLKCFKLVSLSRIFLCMLPVHFIAFPDRKGILHSSFNRMYNSLVSYTPPHLCQPTEQKGWDSPQLQSPAHRTTSLISFPSSWLTCSQPAS